MHAPGAHTHVHAMQVTRERKASDKCAHLEPLLDVLQKRKRYPPVAIRKETLRASACECARTTVRAACSSQASAARSSAARSGACLVRASSIFLGRDECMPDRMHSFFHHPRPACVSERRTRFLEVQAQPQDKDLAKVAPFPAQLSDRRRRPGRSVLVVCRVCMGGHEGAHRPKSSSAMHMYVRPSKTMMWKMCRSHT
jgi:hypothetical protein